MDFFTKIVNDFGTKDYPNKQDASLKYAKDKSLILYFGYFSNGFRSDADGRMLSFKGFLDSYKLVVTFDTEKQETFLQDGVDVFGKEVTMMYQISLVVPSASPEEAELNLAKFEELNKMIRGLPKPTSEDAAKPNYILALLANFIHNGTWTKKHSITDFHELKKYAAQIYLSKSNFKIETDMGFWETERGLIPKVFTTQFGMHIITSTGGSWIPSVSIRKEVVGPDGVQQGGSAGVTKTLEQPWNIIKFFKSNGDYNELDVELWPWGVTHSGMEL